MTIQQIENLLAAGFNHDEIMQLARDEPGAAPADQKQDKPAAPDPEPGPAAEEQKKDPEPGPAAEEKKTDPTETNNRLDALEKSIAALVKSIQTQNVRNDSYGGMPDSLEQQTDKIMMSIIRPDIERKAN